MTEHDVLVGFCLRLFTLADELGGERGEFALEVVDRAAQLADAA